MTKAGRRRFCGAHGRFRVIAAIAAMAAIAPAAGSPGAGALTLEECLLEGLAGNGEIAALRAEIAAAGAGLRAAETGRRPLVYGEAGWRRSDNQVIVFSDKLTAGEFTSADFELDTLNDPEAINHGLLAVGIEVPIDLTGGVGAGISAARGNEAAATARLLAAEVDLTARLTEAYHAIALADAAAAVAEEILARALRHEQVAAARAEKGDALRSEPLRAKAARLERTRELERRRADAALARTRLALLMGSPARVIETTAPFPADIEDVGALEDWIAGAGERPDLEAARRGSEAAGEAARSVRATRGPEMSGRARYERNANGLEDSEGSYLLGLSVRWNAYDGGRGPRIDEAEARAAAAAARVRALEDGTRLEVERSWREAKVADAALLSTAEGAEASEEARRITAERYAAGLMPLTDLLDAEGAASGARLAAIAARYDALVARVRLRQSAGRLRPPAAADTVSPVAGAPPAGEEPR